MLLDRVAETAGRPFERLLERFVRERLDPAAVVADEVMVVVCIGVRGLEPGDPVADVDALHEPQLGERLERPVHACDAGRSTGRVDAVVDLLRRPAAVLRGEVLDDGASRAAAAQTGGAEPFERPFGPAVMPKR